ncbi:MAG: response regulator transcription factor [Bacteroidota bacterium]
MEKKKVALVDDHKLFREGIKRIVNSFVGFQVVLEANSGEEFLDRLKDEIDIDIALVDIKMRQMDGFEVTKWLSQHRPDTQVLALSMYGDEIDIIKMLKCGAKGYLLKDVAPDELNRALEDVVHKGFYVDDRVGQILIKIPTSPEKAFSDGEMGFLKWCCTELTYKEIADKMCVSPRTVDGYRESLFAKLGVKNRVGLVIYAIKNRIYLV